MSSPDVAAPRAAARAVEHVDQIEEDEARDRSDHDEEHGPRLAPSTPLGPIFGGLAGKETQGRPDSPSGTGTFAWMGGGGGRLAPDQNS